jgi:signal peptidase I
MTSQKQDDRPWKQRNRPYIYAVVLALILTMFVAPEIQESNAMSPTIQKGTLVVIKKDTYSVKRGIPELGSVVILAKDAATELSKDNIIARVVGLPGETITIKDGKYYRDNKEYKVKGSTGNLGDDMTVQLASDEVFLLCDNRDIIMDSRSSKLGPVNMKKIRGKVLLGVWPFSEFGGIK